MRRIELTKGAYALVDDEDYCTIARYKWCLNCQGYAVRGFRRNGANHMERMHRVIMGHPEFDGIEVDHINGNRLDNRKENLRLVSRKENSYNTKRHTGGSSLYKGVSWMASKQKWRSRITVDGVEKHLGLYESELEAAEAYNEAAKHYYGQYARLNIMSNDFKEEK